MPLRFPIQPCGLASTPARSYMVLGSKSGSWSTAQTWRSAPHNLQE